MIQFTTWGPSKLADYEQCPMMAKHKHLLKTCIHCFKGKVLGGFDTPAICDTCGKENVKGPALVKGDRIGKVVDSFIAGATKELPPEVRHPDVHKIIEGARKSPRGAAQIDVILDKDWRPVRRFAPGWWFWGKIDWRVVTKALAKVIDWKTGGLDKRTGAVRQDGKYDDQLASYMLATLCQLPAVQKVEAKLVFLECAPRFKVGEPGGPVVEKGSLARKDLEKEQARWLKKLKPFFSDEVFAPRPGFYCTWCGYAKGKGGPCRY